MITKNQMFLKEEFFMSVLPKELVRDFIKNQSFSSSDNVLDLLKEMFKDVLQETLEVELEEKLGYDKYHYSFIFFDAIHYKVRTNKQIVNKAVFVAAFYLPQVLNLK